MKLLFLAALFAYCVAPAAGLTCFRCGFSSNLCILKDTCEANELCFTRNITVASITLFASGCTNKDNCGKQVTDTFLNINYQSYTQCCNVDLCNGASAVQASVIALPVMVLAWFLGIW